MRKLIVPLLLIFFVSLFPAKSYAQKIFNEINTGNNDGESIACIVQDHPGCIWFGKVGEGLIKYNGSKFITYTHDDKDTNSITCARPEAIAGDSFNNIWIGTLVAVWICLTHQPIHSGPFVKVESKEGEGTIFIISINY